MGKSVSQERLLEVPCQNNTYKTGNLPTKALTVFEVFLTDFHGFSRPSHGFSRPFHDFSREARDSEC